MSPALVILAAGMGSRYGGLKQIDPLGPNGETILDYSIYDAHRAGFGQVVFIIRKDFADAFRARISQNSAVRSGLEVRYVMQDLHELPPGFQAPTGREKPWGTTHAVWCTRQAVDRPFATTRWSATAWGKRCPNTARCHAVSARLMPPASWSPSTNKPPWLPTPPAARLEKGPMAPSFILRRKPWCP